MTFAGESDSGSLLITSLAGMISCRMTNRMTKVAPSARRTGINICSGDLRMEDRDGLKDPIIASD